MSIWAHESDTRIPLDALAYATTREDCPFCRCELLVLDDLMDVEQQGALDCSTVYTVCPVCGWWNIHQTIVSTHNPGWSYSKGAAAVLREFALDDVSAPIDEVRRHLTKKYDSRFTINPYVYEEVVASVFRLIGYDVKVTGHSGDDGIDVVLQRNDSVIGVQVKRYKHAIKVEQIRSLAGALVLNGMTEGIFVTTSRFQSGAEDTVSRYHERGFAIQLWDASRFYEALQIAETAVDRSYERLAQLLRVVELRLTASPSPSEDFFRPATQIDGDGLYTRLRKILSIL